MDKTVKIDSYLLEEIKKFRNSKKLFRIKYTSDKQVVAEAVIDFLQSRGFNIDG